MHIDLPVAEEARVYDAIKDCFGLSVGIEVVIHRDDLSDLGRFTFQKDQHSVGLTLEASFALHAVHVDPVQLNRLCRRIRCSLHGGEPPRC